MLPSFSQFLPSMDNWTVCGPLRLSEHPYCHCVTTFVLGVILERVQHVGLTSLYYIDQI